MLYKKLNDKHEIPMIGIGTWQQTNIEKGVKAIRFALKIGYRHLDTADIYGNHDIVKEAIKNFSREKLYITTKLWKDFLHPKHVEKECDKALMQLGLDYLDLYLIHWPDRAKPYLDITYEMNRLIEKGKIKSQGVSNYTIHHLQDLLNQGLKTQVNQVEFHPLLNQKDLLEFCNRNEIALIAYSPIARGEVFNEPVLIELGQKYKKSASQISLRWLVQKDIVSIPKATSEKHIKENFDIFDFEISKEDILKIDKISTFKRKRLINPDFADFEY
jgi:methylglyoxal/glyoxal reductase